MSFSRLLALVIAISLGGVWRAAAEDLETEFRGLEQRLDQLTDRLEAQKEDRVAGQSSAAGQQLEGDRLESDRTGLLALSSFLEKTEFSGFVAVGWSHISDSVDREINTFQLDQAWVQMQKVPTEESRAGFQIALEMGAYATQGGNADWETATPEQLVIGPGGSDSVAIYTAYLSYLAPLGNGLLINGGILESVLGIELEQQDANWQISRGTLWYLQPKTNTGVTARYYITDQLTVMAGAINNSMAGFRRDDNSAKAITSQFRFDIEEFNLRAAVNWGKADQSHDCLLAYAGASSFPAGSEECDSEGIFDVVASLKPSRNLALWVNYDYLWAKGGKINGELTANAVAIAGRYGILDSLGLSLRIEWLKVVEDSGGRNDTYSRQWDVTITLDHKLTKNLTAKVEYRRDDVESRMQNGVFDEQGWQANSVQTQLLYQF